MRKLAIVFAMLLFALPALAQESQQAIEAITGAPAAPEQELTSTAPGILIGTEMVPMGAHVFVAPMGNGFENYLIAGLQKKHVPVVVVTDRSLAEYEITGVASSERAGWAKMLFLSSQASHESAGIKMVDLSTGRVVFAYAVDKPNSVRGKQSAGEACAKHLKEKIQKRPEGAEPTEENSKEQPSDSSKVIAPGAKIFVDPMPDSFDEYIKAAFEKKKVPVTVVNSLDQAEFELSGTSETEKAGAAKIILFGSWHSKESASIKVANLQDNIVVFAYAYYTAASSHGKKSSAESCAKHLKKKIESGK
jgi:hypothetical protein